LVAPGGRRGAYHRECLRCEVCEKPTERFVVVDVATAGTKDLLVCGSCHDERFAEKCGGCLLALRGSTIAALGLKFHAECFRCALCRAGLASGTFFPIDTQANQTRFPEWSLGTPRLSRGRSAACCPECHVSKLAEKCRACGSGIAGDLVVALGGKKFHRECFACALCRASLANTKHVPSANETEAYCVPCHAETVAERCGCGCGRAACGDVVSALGKRFIRNHFACFECRGSFPNGEFVKVDVADEPSSGFENREGPPPPENRKRRVSSSPIAATTARAVCEKCYAKNHAERCGSCAIPLVGCRFARVEATGGDPADPDAKGEALCLRCEGQPGSLCDDCGRCVRVDARAGRGRAGFLPERTARRHSGGVAVIGQCASCRATAVTSDDRARRLFARIVERMETLGARDVPECLRDGVVVRVADADRLAEAAKAAHRGPAADGPRGVTRTKVELRGTAPRANWNDEWNRENRSPATVRRVFREALDCESPDVTAFRRVEDVLVLRGMSEVAACATLAHEYGHCYLFARGFPNLDLKTEEGVCELFAWLWCGGGDALAGSRGSSGAADHAVECARRRARMERRRDPVYGDGFRDAKRALVEFCGGDLWAVLEHVRANGALPRRKIV